MGSFADDMTAARVFDVTNIQLKGTNAKTNFRYDCIDVIAILHQPKLTQ